MSDKLCIKRLRDHPTSHLDIFVIGMHTNLVVHGYVHLRFTNDETANKEDISNYLQDWWSGNGNLYGLLDQDLGNINGLGLEDYTMQRL